MGFRCQKCKKISQKGEKQHKVVIEKREKTYHYFVVKIRLQRGKTKEIYTKTKPDEKDRNKQVIKQFTTKGWEIAREQNCCKECANV